MKKILKNTYFSALIISILAAALWENFLSPLCTNLYIYVSSVLDKFITSFSNSTYRSISYGFDDTYSLCAIIFLMGFYFIMICIPLTIPISHKLAERNTQLVTTSKNQQENFKKFVRLYTVIVIVGFSFICLSYWKSYLYI